MACYGAGLATPSQVPTSSPPSATRSALTFGLSLAVMLEAPRALALENSGDALRSGIVVGGALAGVLALDMATSENTSCRLCQSNGVDRSARDRLVWRHPENAASLSDFLVVALPASSIGASFLIGLNDGLGQGLTDGLVVAEAVLVATLGTQLVKVAAARQRPYGYYGTGAYPGSQDENRSFWSGHTATAFSAAASVSMVAYHHDWPGFPWVVAGGVLCAGTIGYLRLAADKHWLTDVLGGAAFGSAVGVAVPLLELGPRSSSVRVSMTLEPLGVTGAF